MVLVQGGVGDKPSARQAVLQYVVGARGHPPGRPAPGGPCGPGRPGRPAGPGSPFPFAPAGPGGPCCPSAGSPRAPCGPGGPAIERPGSPRLPILPRTDLPGTPASTALFAIVHNNRRVPCNANRKQNGTLLSTVGMRCAEACDARGKLNMHKSCYVGLARVGLEYQACHVGLACQVCRRRELAWPASPRYPPHLRAAQAQPSPSRALAATRLASPRRERTSGCCMSEHGTGATALMGRTIITRARSEL